MGRKATFYLLGRLFILFTVAALAAAVWCRFAAANPDGSASRRLFAGVGAYALFFLNSGLAVWWLVRRRWLVALLPLVALIVGAPYMAGLVRMPRFGTCPEGDIRIATLNVHGFQAGRTRGIAARETAAMLREEGADIACLQEVIDDPEHPFEALAAHFSEDFPFYIRREEQAVFSRYPIENSEYVRFSGGNQSCMWVDVTVDGRPLRIVSTHFQTSGVPETSRRFRKNYDRRPPLDSLCNVLESNTVLRNRQANIVRRMVTEAFGAVVVVGDFNELGSSRTYEIVSEGLTDAFRACGHGWGATFGGVVRIDYILFNDWFEGVDAHVVGDRELSDHRPVVAALRFVRP